jgi:hypothetical protein
MESTTATSLPITSRDGDAPRRRRPCPDQAPTARARPRCTPSTAWTSTSSAPLHRDLGPSGSGKSTSCSAWPDWTRGLRLITIAGTEITTLDGHSTHPPAPRRIGFVFQAYNLVPTLTAEQNIPPPAGPGGPRCGPHLVEEVTTSLALTTA